MTGLRGAANSVIDAATGTRTTWAELPVIDVPAPAVYAVGSGLDALPALVAHARTGAEMLVVAAGRLDPGLAEELSVAGFNLVADGAVTPPTTPREPEPGRLWLLTSGSTGRPKRIGHTLESLTTVAGDLPPRTWLCPYSPGTYAWWQVVTLGLGAPGQDLVMVDPAASADPAAWVAAAVEYAVTAASGTPTFWRRTLLGAGDELAKVPLEQVTLGGEPVDQAVLDQLREVFPAARISWIYASSEVGASIVVHDGRAGFPVEWLDRAAPGRPEISIASTEAGDELVITSPHHGVGLEGAVRTGDAVRIEDGRVLITGRLDSDEINVGGSKVSAGVVRGVLQSHPDVAWASVRGRKAPLVGTVVVAEVVVTGGLDTAELTRWAAERLPDYAVPRRITIRPEIPLKETLKSDV